MVGEFRYALGLARERDKTLKNSPKQALFMLLLLTAIVSGCAGIPQGVEPVRPFDVQRYKLSLIHISEPTRPY